MENYEQMEFDVMLQSERDLKENAMVAIEFACNQLKSEGLPKVAGRHEGYGIAADSSLDLTKAMKSVNGDMGSFLKTLQADDVDAVNAASSLYNSTCGVVIAAIQMAAQANRIMSDLYEAQKDIMSPLEEYYSEQEEEDGFEEAGEGEEDDN